MPSRFVSDLDMNIHLSKPSPASKIRSAQSWALESIQISSYDAISCKIKDPLPRCTHVIKPVDTLTNQQVHKLAVDWAVKMRIMLPELETSICDVKYHISLVLGTKKTISSSYICPADGSQYYRSTVGLVFMEWAAGRVCVVNQSQATVDSVATQRFPDAVFEYPVASNSSIQSRAYMNQLLLLNQSQALHIQSTWFPGAKNRRSSKAQQS
ncbi:hypothetical protein F511_37301 [Dorcoceras hygrometricum]|uniref:Uncharacterized protein n=1 Tax=Dorcoceras hygrometricum TaxID=472368 RepID=A0A2Z7B183_9LAMI|nr:hypothetical protein F511_37301 [Dorcoceras hygrometricum]